MMASVERGASSHVQKQYPPHCENMIKKLFTLSAVKAAILLLLGFSYQQVSSAQTISIGTVRIDATKDNADVLGNGTVSYEAANLLLKLKGASIEGSIVIYHDAPLYRGTFKLEK